MMWRAKIFFQALEDSAAGMYCAEPDGFPGLSELGYMFCDRELTKVVRLCGGDHFRYFCEEYVIMIINRSHVKGLKD